MTVRQIKKVDWQYLVNRREALLFKSITDTSYGFFQNLTSVPWRAHYMLRLGNGDLLPSARELNQLRKIFIKKGIPLFQHFRQQLVKYVKRLDILARQIERVDCSKLTQAKLYNLVVRYIKAARQAANFLLPLPVAGEVISEQILSELPEAKNSQKQKWLSTLVYSRKENQHTIEEKSFYKLAQAYKTKQRNFQRLLNRHLRRFAWIGARGYWFDRAWTKGDIAERIRNFLKQGKNPRKELWYINDLPRQQKKSFIRLIKTLNIKKNSSLYELILIAQEFAYLRTWRTDIIYGSGYRARNLFYEVARRANINKDGIAYLTWSEVLRMTKTKKMPISEEELKRRKEYTAILVWKNLYKILSGKDWEEKLKSIVSQEIVATPELKGSVAFPGRIKGVTKLVFTAKDVRKVQSGDILVAVMTFPHLVPAMEKAAAFITDEGGILCHAAIISREMKKPCVIGTKIATKVLKDGDLVEVDANKGVVRKLK